MAYKDMALAAQIDGAYSCCTAVMARTAASETIHRLPDAKAAPKRGGIGVSKIELDNAGVVVNKRGNTNGPSLFSYPLPSGPLRCTYWMARCDGSIEISSASAPERVLAVVPQQARSVVVTCLLQIAHNRVAASDADGFLRVLDLVTLEVCQRVQAHKAAITCMVPVRAPATHCPEESAELVPRTSFFMTASLDSSIAKWDGVTLECLGRIKGRFGNFTALVASAAGAFAFSGGEDGVLRMWSVGDNTQVLGRSGRRKKVVKKGTKSKGETLLSKSDSATEPMKKKKTRASSSTLQTISVAESSRRSSPAVSISARKVPCLTERCAAGGKLRPATPRIDSVTRAGRAGTANSGLVFNGDEGEDDEEDDDEEDEEEDDDDNTGVGDNNNNGNKRGHEGKYQTVQLPGGSGALRGNVVGGSCVASESQTERKAAKGQKTKKKKIFDYATVLQQLVGPSSEDPVARHLSAMHRLNMIERHETLLLWPLKHEHHRAITGLALVRDRLLVTASRDGVAKMFAIPSGRLICSVQRGRAALTGLVLDEVRCLLWISSADGSFAVYNVLHPDVVQVHGWRDVNMSHPRLMPLAPNVMLSQLYMFATSRGEAMSHKLGPHKQHASALNRPSHRDGARAKNFLGWASEPSAVSELPSTATLTCVRLDDGDGGAVIDAPLLRSLDRQLVKLQTSRLGGGLRDAFFNRVLGRPVDPEGNELPEYLFKEKRRVSSALHCVHSWLFLQRMYFRWLTWGLRRVTRDRRMRKLCFLANVQLKRLLVGYFGRWRQWSASTRRRMRHLDMCSLERCAMSATHDWVGKGPVTSCTEGLGSALGDAVRRCILRRYYCNWLLYARQERRRVVQSTAFNRLFLSFCDSRLSDASFVWRHMGAIASAAQRRRRALWLLEQRMRLDNHKKRGQYMRQWMQFVVTQKEARQSLSLVETLSSLLVNETALRWRFFFKWHRFAFFEARLQRLDEEKMTMQREWMVVQNAVDSTTPVSELRLEKESLETSIARLAFERDEVESRNAAIRSEVSFLHMQRSLESLLALYRDAGDFLGRRREPLASAPHSRRQSLSVCNRTSSLLSCEGWGSDTTVLRQLGAVLRALKATVIRFGRHKALISAAHERVMQLSIYECPPGTSDWGCNLSLDSNSGDSSVLRSTSNALVSERGTLTGWRRGSVACTTGMSASLADEFDRTTMQLQALLVDATRLTGMDFNEPFTPIQFPTVLELSTSEEKNTVGFFDHASLRNLNFISPSTRTEALPLIIDLIVMFDSVKAHSDTEVEGGGRGLSTRGVPRIVPLPLRSLCKPQTAAWLVRNAEFLLELMSPGISECHMRLQELSGGVAESRNEFGGGDGVGVATAPASRRSAQGVWPKLSMEELNTCPKKHRSQSVSFSESRSQASRPHGLSSNQPSNTARRKILVPSSSFSTSRPQSYSDFREEDQEASRTMPSFSLPIPCSGPSTPTKSEHASVTTRPYLGFRVMVGRSDAGRSTLTIHEVMESYHGAVGGVLREGPAFAAGLRAGDQLVRFAGHTVTELAAFNAVVARHARPWGSIPVVFSRNGELISTTIVVGEKARN